MAAAAAAGGGEGPMLFLSDLHLPPQQPSPLRERFLVFLNGPAREAKSVYILGDLFEAWIGDDVGLQIYAAEVAALSALCASGVAVYFLAGNRDFLVSDSFFELTGVIQLKDPHPLLIHNRPTLLSHGDIYCTDDGPYQRWRWFSRLKWAQWLFMRLPRSRRQKIALGLRNNSDSSKRNKAEHIMDVNSRALRLSMAQHGVTLLIHGHTHRPGTYPVDLPIAPAQRIVLPDWRLEEDREDGGSAASCDYLRFDEDGSVKRLAV